MPFSDMPPAGWLVLAAAFFVMVGAIFIAWITSIWNDPEVWRRQPAAPFVYRNRSRRRG